MKLAISIDISGNPLEAAKKMRDSIVDGAQEVTRKAQKLTQDCQDAIEGRRAKKEYMEWAEQMWEEGHVEVKDSPMLPKEEIYG